MYRDKFYNETATSEGYIHPELETLENEAYNAGYDVKFEGDSLDNLVITLKANQDEDMMPKLTVWVDPKSSGDPSIYVLQCKATFPVISTERNLTYSDDGEHWTNEWRKVGKFMTYIMDARIDLDEEYE